MALISVRRRIINDEWASGQWPEHEFRRRSRLAQKMSDLRAPGAHPPLTAGMMEICAPPGTGLMSPPV